MTSISQNQLPKEYQKRMSIYSPSNKFYLGSPNGNMVSEESQPTITGCFPETGYPGTLLTVYGTGFIDNPEAHCDFGGSYSAIPFNVTSTSFNVISPKNAYGPQYLSYTIYNYDHYYRSDPVNVYYGLIPSDLPIINSVIYYPNPMPISEEFYPLTAEFKIIGTNFGTDPKNVSVYFNVQGMLNGFTIFPEISFVNDTTIILYADFAEYTDFMHIQLIVNGQYPITNPTIYF